MIILPRNLFVLSVAFKFHLDECFLDFFFYCKEIIANTRGNLGWDGSRLELFWHSAL